MLDPLAIICACAVLIWSEYSPKLGKMTTDAIYVINKGVRASGRSDRLSGEHEGLRDSLENMQLPEERRATHQIYTRTWFQLAGWKRHQENVFLLQWISSIRGLNLVYYSSFSSGSKMDFGLFPTLGLKMVSEVSRADRRKRRLKRDRRGECRATEEFYWACYRGNAEYTRNHEREKSKSRKPNRTSPC